MSTTAISPRAVLVTKANVPNCRDEYPAGWIAGAFAPGGWQTLMDWPEQGSVGIDREAHEPHVAGPF